MRSEGGIQQLLIILGVCGGARGEGEIVGSWLSGDLGAGVTGERGAGIGM